MSRPLVLFDHQSSSPQALLQLEELTAGGSAAQLFEVGRDTGLDDRDRAEPLSEPI